MAGSIKLFQSVQNSYKTLGIYSPNSNQIFSFNLKKLFFLLGLIVTFVSRFGYFLFEAKFVEENGFKSFYQSISVLIALGDFLLSIWQMPEILQLIEMYDAFIRKSESIILMRNKFVDLLNLHFQMK